MWNSHKQLSFKKGVESSFKHGLSSCTDLRYSLNTRFILYASILLSAKTLHNSVSYEDEMGQNNKHVLWHRVQLHQ